MFSLLEKAGVPTHLVEEINDRETIVKKVEIVPLEVIVRNVAAGSFSKKLGIEEGTPLKCPTLEFSYKNDDLGDPFINDYYALGLGLATKEEIDTISKYAFMVNDFMKDFFKKLNIDLIDFKIEFGRTPDGTIPTPAAFGTARPTRSSTRIASAAIWAELRTHTTKLCTVFLINKVKGGVKWADFSELPVIMTA